MTVEARTETGGRNQPPLTVTPPRRRLVLIRIITALVIAGPALGATAAVAVAFVRGVSRSDVAALAVMYALSTLGVTIGFHRHFAHRAFRTSRAMQVLFVVVGSMAAQGSLFYWVSTHRRHQQFSDTPNDPHSPHYSGDQALRGWPGFWHGHIGWMFARRMTNPVRFAPDLVRDPLVFAVQQRYGAWVTLGLAAPPLLIFSLTRDPWTALSGFLWAGPLRIFLVHQASWAVGSISHLWGSRPFATQDRSANNWLVAAVAFGEGLQNNHHAFPWAAHHGLRPWEPDLSGVVIDLLSATGLVWDVARPSPEAMASKLRRVTNAGRGKRE
jgi:stearoyl-CoA desaturase (delta-9 desaturase)